MATATDVRGIPIIDTDTHVVEPPDLWTSRVSSKWGDLVPHVAWDPVAEEEAWYSGAARLGAVGAPAMAGWSEHPPYHPRRFADTDPASWDPTRRAAVMDSYGIKSQILYPNVAVFDARSIVNMGDPALQLACIQAYNDFLVDFGAEQPGRFIPVAALPFWDRERDPRRDRALRRHRPQGDRVHPGPRVLRSARAHRPVLGPDVALGRGEGPARQLPHRLG